MDTIQRLGKVALFDEMSDERRAWWADRFRRERYPRGALVIRQGDSPASFYLVEKGELRARTRAEGQELARAYFYGGDHFGETSLLTGEPRNATVDVLTDAELHVLDKMDFDQMMVEFPVIRERLLNEARQREETGGKRFDWEQPDEVTLFFSLKHWSAFLRTLGTPVMLGFLGLVAATFYVLVGLGDLLTILTVIAAGTLLALAVLTFIYQFFDWRNDHYIITSLRVLHVERVLLLQEERDEAPLSRVQDVQVLQSGIFPNLLNVGDVLIQTAAATQKVVFAGVHRPKAVREALFAPMHRAQAQEKAEVREKIRQELGQRLNIPVAALDDEEDSHETERPADQPSAEEQKEVQPSFDYLGQVRRGLSWLWSWVRFETWIISEDGKTITWRKNGWRLVKKSLAPLFAGFAVVLLAVVLQALDLGFALLFLFLALSLIFIFGWWFYLYWDWQNDIYQVSGNRLIDLKKRPLYLEEIRRETTLDRIENIGLSIPSMIAQMFNFGTVVIETAGETGAFEFEFVHDPRGVQAEIFNRREKYLQEQLAVEKHRRQSELAEWFEIYDELRQRQGLTGTYKGELRDGFEADSVVG